MKIEMKSLIAALILGGSISTASASAVITDITASGPGLGSFSVLASSTNDKGLDLSKVFDSVNPITLTFTVAHSVGNGGSYDVIESIINNTGTAFSDFHLSITEPTNASGNGVVFTSFNSSTLDGFVLDSPSMNQVFPFNSSGPRDLNFTGSLAVGDTANASFNLSPFDPGVGNSYTFTITQTPTVSAIPEPETYALLLAGLSMMGFIARRKSTKYDT
ncbi:MAG: PEP-CTERM sorting domain-containing protein [Pseudomonadota bacterium]|nr:PEP-CTERM sorting domain-containing protein [Pseudomonadota bacterium]